MLSLQPFPVVIARFTMTGVPAAVGVKKTRVVDCPVVTVAPVTVHAYVAPGPLSGAVNEVGTPAQKVAGGERRPIIGAGFTVIATESLMTLLHPRLSVATTEYVLLE